MVIFCFVAKFSLLGHLRVNLLTRHVQLFIQLFQLLNYRRFHLNAHYQDKNLSYHCLLSLLCSLKTGGFLVEIVL